LVPHCCTRASALRWTLHISGSAVCSQGTPAQLQGACSKHNHPQQNTVGLDAEPEDGLCGEGHCIPKAAPPNRCLGTCELAAAEEAEGICTRQQCSSQVRQRCRQQQPEQQQPEQQRSAAAASSKRMRQGRGCCRQPGLGRASDSQQPVGAAAAPTAPTVTAAAAEAAARLRQQPLVPNKLPHEANTHVVGSQTALDLRMQTKCQEARRTT
jgi:hypothetical protein